MANGGTLIANTDHKVKERVTLALTTTRTFMVMGCGNSGRGTSTIIRRVGTTNNSTISCRYGMSSFSRYRGVVATLVGRCGRVSVLMGGTKVAESNLVVGVDRTSCSTILSAGLGNTFGAVHRVSHCFLGRGSKEVVGVSSISKVLKGTKRTGCDTDGTKIVKLAGTMTERLTDQKVATGTITPNFMRARVASILTSTTGRGLLSRVPLNEPKGAGSVTGTMLFLTSSTTNCVANRILSISKKVTV